MLVSRKDVMWVVKEVAASAVEIAAGAVKLIPQLLMKGYVLWNFILTGVVLVAARDLFMWMCPTILRLTKPIVDYINILLVFLSLFVNSCITVIDGIIVVIDALKTIFTGHKVHEHLYHWVHIKSLSYSEFRDTVSRIPPLCTKFDNAGVIIQYIIRINVHEYTCPAVRYLYPLQWLFEVCQSALSWTYYGSAAPFTNVDGENCLRVDDTTYEYICCGLGLGYLVLEFFLPILLLYILLLCMGKGIAVLLDVGLYVFLKGAEVAVYIMFAVIHELQL